jgi:tetratricopeptide (TPR) repeat protein
MLETIREHAAALLDDAERARAEAAHIAYYRSFVARRTFVGTSALDDVALIDADIDNVRAGYDRSAAAGDHDTALALVVDLGAYWGVRCHYRELGERIRRPLERGARDPARRADAVRLLSWHAYVVGESAEAVDLATRGIDLATSTRNLDALCGCHQLLGTVALDRGDVTTARRHFELARAIAVELDLDDTLARTNSNLADLALALGDHDEARQRWEHNLTQPLAPWREVRARWGLATIARRDGRLDEAADDFTRSLQLSEVIGQPHMAGVALVGLALVAADRGEHAESRALLERADAVLEVAGIELTGTDAEAYRDARSSTLAAQEPDERASR